MCIGSRGHKAFPPWHHHWHETQIWNLVSSAKRIGEKTLRRGEVLLGREILSVSAFPTNLRLFSCPSLNYSGPHQGGMGRSLLNLCYFFSVLRILFLIIRLVSINWDLADL